jgi:predicted nucleotidyltransferase component of viral defense system
MIPKNFVTQWRKQAQWSDDVQVEQDLLISRILIELFNHASLAERLCFRGGTALYKLFLLPAARYSEDIDLVQLYPDAIGPIFDTIKRVLEPLLGLPRWRINEGRATLEYKFLPNGHTVKSKIKIEINSREHFSVFAPCKKEFSIESDWFSGKTMVQTYEFEELLGTKLRALFQRKKGRDLFDLWMALQTREFEIEKVITTFKRYLAFENKNITRAMFEKNLLDKFNSESFLGDVSLLLRPGIPWVTAEGLKVVMEKLICHIPGEAYQLK